MIDYGKWALDNRYLVRFLIAILVVGGALAFYDMSKLEDPEIKVKEAVVVTPYPGASPHQVELEVTDLLEKSIRSMKNVEKVKSRSMNDLSMISVELSKLVPDDEVDQNWDVLRRKVADVQRELPPGTMKSIVKDDFGDVYGMFYAVTSDGIEDAELIRYVDMVKREMQSIDGITSVEIFGEQKECINIELLEERMANMGVHPAEVITTLNGQNKTVYSGYYEAGDYRLRVSVDDRYRTVDDIGNLILQGHEDDQLRLRDIATVYMGFEDPSMNQMRYDKVPAYGLAIAANSESDITKLGKIVEQKIEDLKEERIPAGVDFHKVFFQAERVTEALDTFLLNLIESVIIVVVVLMFTMGIRSGMIIGTSLIVIVFGSFLILNMFDGTLQRVSLAAFILAMGMLVDNAIVIVDGILVAQQRGTEKRESLTAIGRQTAMPLLGATLIAILAFFPIFLSPDTAGVYVRDLFIVLAVSLLLSWVLALTHVPLMASWMLKKPKEGSGDTYNSKYYKALRGVLLWGLKHKTMTIGVAVGLVALSVFCYRFLPQSFFPDMNYDQLYIEYKLPEGTNNNKVKSDLEEIEDYLLGREEVGHVTTALGGTPARYNLVRSIANPSLSYGELIVDFKTPKQLVDSMWVIQNYLTAQYPEAYVRLKRYNLMYQPYPIEAQFSGPDPAVLKKLTAQAEHIMKSNPKTMLVRNDWEPHTPVLMVKYNQPIARSIGLTREDIGLSLLSATGGIPVGAYYQGDQKKNIYIKSTDNNGDPIEGLNNVPVFSLIPPIKNLSMGTIQGLATGTITEEDIVEGALRTVPLNQASERIDVEWEDPLILRFNGERAMRAQCNPVPGVSADEARNAILEDIENIELPAGYSLLWQGEYSASTESMKYLFRSFPLAIILMITILILLFKDYRKPAIIFCCMPLIAIGVIFSVLLSGKDFGFVAIVGALGLIGMMIKNGIVLMDEITLQINEGVEPVQALLDSSSSRFRPVMMASLTTILGMIPLLSDDMFGSLAVTIMGGLLVGTLITLIFIPILYALFFKVKIEK